MERIDLIDWKIRDYGYDKENATCNGNKYLIGNGYLGIRGTLEEYTKELLPAINLAGIYDQVGDAFREPLNAPNALYTYLSIDDERCALPESVAESHEVCLDYRSALFSRQTVWETKKGRIRFSSERFASLVDPHLIVMEVKVQCDFSGELSIITGIDGDVWDMHGPHYDEINYEENYEEKNYVKSKPFLESVNVIKAIGITHENKDQVCVLESSVVKDAITCEISIENRSCLRKFKILVEPLKTYTLYKYISIYTSKDDEEYIQCAEKSILLAKQQGYSTLKELHMAEWEKKWKVSEVLIEGDDAAMEALNYSIYHLHCIAPRHTDNISIAARGLSGQTYKGAVFWDTEMFILDFFLLTEPKVARTLVKYRIDTLKGAMQKAREYGYLGAFYAWESQEGGYDACSDYNVTDVFTNRPMRTYFKDKQIHISSAIVYGIMSYYNVTKDISLLIEGGAKTILECAIFYYDLLVKKVNKEKYELHDVIGPDEYHERVNNNGYTNRMAKYTFDVAIEILNLLDQEERLHSKIVNDYNITALRNRFMDASVRIYQQEPDRNSGIIEQFDGYHKLLDASVLEVKSHLLHPKEYWGGAYGVASHTKIIKQADVVTMLSLFPEEYSTETLWKNWEYYEPRTEHGSSLSACMYALLACECNEADRAYPYFMKSANADIKGGGKEWAGLVYIGGTHPAASGGAYMTAIKGFGGIQIKDGKIKAAPRLPSHWKKLMFRIVLEQDMYQIEIKNENNEGDGVLQKQGIVVITKL